ncbi:MBL fold metallo-hydrolase [Priestia koreensis]|uniref:MBL fold metallo-hydrolase n=1 Tax=Priestia koreensis TaxID=284581 RepID=UPI00203E7A5F|nr:MBL fold metallo-hydrolase [Priestia koreensis]MCM3006873.1 MBL fold metallo-hydrolase [Priestia koreensis]
MKVANGVEVIELKIDAMGNEIVLHPTLVFDNEISILIDTGIPGQLHEIKGAMAKADVSFQSLIGIILTHQDIDHIGSAPQLLEEFNKPMLVYAHKEDQPYIEGDVPLIKTDISRMSKQELDALPNEVRYLYNNPPSVKVNKLLKDNQVLPYCGGIEVIYTPGHSPGHVSLYLKKTKTLVAGDAMVKMNGRLWGPVKQTTLDMKAATQSLEKLLDYDIETVICYHGGVFKGNPRPYILEILSEIV